MGFVYRHSSAYTIASMRTPHHHLAGHPFNRIPPGWKLRLTLNIPRPQMSIQFLHPCGVLRSTGAPSRSHPSASPPSSVQRLSPNALLAKCWQLGSKHQGWSDMFDSACIKTLLPNLKPRLPGMASSDNTSVLLTHPRLGFLLWPGVAVSSPLIGPFRVMVIDGS